jgi:hypothetical protein
MDADDLYGLPLDRFVPERGALARSLRADGRRQEAAEVAALRKPSVAAWAVNQLLRTQGRAVAELFDAGDRLREAQADLLAGSGDGRALRSAGQRERAAVDALVTFARGLLTSEGQDLSPGTLEKVADTLHAAALDHDARRVLRDGRLERELRHVGLGIGDLPEAAPARPATKRKAPARRAKQARPAVDDRADAERLARERAEARRTERERAKARKAAEASESAARRLVDRARRAVRVAEERRERATGALRDADEALAAARDEAEAATAAHRRAREELESL